MFIQNEQQLQEVEKVVAKKYGQRREEGVRVQGWTAGYRGMTDLMC